MVNDIIAPLDEALNLLSTTSITVDDQPPIVLRHTSVNRIIHQFTPEYHTGRRINEFV